MVVFFKGSISFHFQFWNLVAFFATPCTTPALFGGGLLGYVIYDCTHYYLHHGQPSKDPAKHLKVKT
jgi:dihydroceramide fatty acyl 2-hydroxylase